MHRNRWVKPSQVPQPSFWKENSTYFAKQPDKLKPCQVPYPTWVSEYLRPLQCSWHHLCLVPQHVHHLVHLVHHHHLARLARHHISRWKSCQSQVDIFKPSKSRWFSKFLMSFGRNYAHLFEAGELGKIGNYESKTFIHSTTRVYEILIFLYIIILRSGSLA